MALSLTTIRLCSWPWPSRDRFATTSAEKHVWKKNREEKERRRRRKEGYWQQKFQGLLSIPSQIAEKRAWEGSFSQIADTQDFMLNLEEREEREGKRKVASDNELNFRFSSEYFSQPPLTVTLSRTWRKEKREKGEGRLQMTMN
ncbi:uncharacterized protein LOC115994137 isoform X1 [Quercus lobata]|uniref:uncharacterized protein LOC115994137 isoform X1 n=1 Tax=Quercus lobata TaxID=97700 RepID=UPI001244A6B9|nr:uncharacterized protein LOC115994137 isoform X1 [Quercus lobata]XP_030974035.1 uncharacterized protein LOC115994137 isoform X1 [Quercus lobata]